MFGDLFGSKKFWCMLSGVVIAVAEAMGLGLPIHVFTAIEGMLGSYCVGQGIADSGKEAVKLQIAKGVTKLLS
jgi:hypothetical protein